MKPEIVIGGGQRGVRRMRRARLGGASEISEMQREEHEPREPEPAAAAPAAADRPRKKGAKLSDVFKRLSPEEKKKVRAMPSTERKAYLQNLATALRGGRVGPGRAANLRKAIARNGRMSGVTKKKALRSLRVA